MERNSGVTLIELMATLAIAVILIGATAPGLGSLIKDIRLSTLTNEFIGALQLTRSHALRSQHPAVLCKAPSGMACDEAAHWDQGWMAFEDRNGDGGCADTDGDSICDDDGGRIFLVRNGLPADLRMLANGLQAVKRIRFDSLGSAAGYMSTFTLCDNRGPAHARSIRIAITGRAQALPGDSGIGCRP